MKRKITFASQIPTAMTAETIKYEKTDNGVRIPLMLFSTRWNRNHAYFQVADLLRWSNKVEKIVWNFNHNLKETGGKYLGNQTKIIAGSLKGEYNDGAFEIFAVVESTDPEVINRADEITAPSIELEVDTDNYKVFEDASGVYFEDFEFVGVAFLTGLLAGSGDARLTGDVETFMQEIKPNNIIMQFKKEELQTFFESEEGKVVFAELIDKYESKSTSKDTWKHPETGEIYQSETEYMIKSSIMKVTEEVNAGLAQFKEAIEQKLESHFAEKEAEEGDQTPPEPTVEPEGEEKPADEDRTIEEFAKAGQPTETVETDVKPTANKENFQKVPEFGQDQDTAGNADQSSKVSRYTRIKNNLKNIL